MNVYTKENIDFEIIDLYDTIKNDEVKIMYDKYRGICEKYLTHIFNADTDETRYYVYAWYAKTNPKRYFYIGKGTRTRYRHILSDIKKFKNGKQNLRYKRYSQIQDRWGIDYEILVKDLTEYEALIYEECKKLEFLDNGEVLLNVEGIPDKFLPSVWECDRCNIPTLTKEPFFKRYFDDDSTPYFDEVNEANLMRTYIYPYFLDFSDSTIVDDKNCILSWLNGKGAKIYKTVSLRTESIIIQGTLPYDRYLEYRKSNKKIFSSKDVIRYIVEHN